MTRSDSLGFWMGYLVGTREDRVVRGPPSPPPKCSYSLACRLYSAAVGAVRGRKIVNHAGLAGEEQPLVDRRSKGHARICMARHGMRIGAARIRIACPRGRRNRMQAFADAVAEACGKLID